MEPNQTENTLSGGETSDRADILKIRTLIRLEDDVHDVLALSWVPQEQRWLYLIKTPFATWPKYVVGWTTPDNSETEILFRCGMESNAIAFYNDLNDGDHL